MNPPQVYMCFYVGELFAILVSRSLVILCPLKDKVNMLNANNIKWDNIFHT